MPSITKDVNSPSNGNGDFKETYDLLDKSLLENGFNTNEQSSSGCFMKRVTSKNSEVPQLLREIFSLDNEKGIWILSRGYKDKRTTQGVKENDAEEAAHLANLGIN